MKKIIVPSLGLMTLVTLVYLSQKPEAKQPLTPPNPLDTGVKIRQEVRPIAPSESLTHEGFDPSTLEIPEEPDFSLTAASITEGAITQGDAPDIAPAEADTHPSVIREKVFSFSKPLSQLLKDLPEETALPKIEIPLFDGETVEVQLMRHEQTDSQNGSVVGVVMGTNEGRVVLGYSEEAQSGSIRISDTEVYSVFYQGDNQHRLVEVDLSKAPPCGHDH